VTFHDQPTAGLRPSAPFVPNALELRQLKKSFGPAEIIRGVDLDILRGERHAIIGPNGAGKTTLFGLISGLLVPTSGDIFLHGKSVAGLPAYEINRRGLCRSFQVTNIFPRMSVWENVRCAILWAAGERYSFLRGIEANPEIAARTESILRSIHLLDRREIPAGVLTYAEQRALEIGITIAGDADVILLDEPTAGMSRHETDRAMELIRQISDRRTLLIVEHDMSVVFSLADRISVLVYGEIIASGAPTEIRANPKVKEAYLGQEAH
jgi:branched-chain amino acid transport system ATP-binding protein